VLNTNILRNLEYLTIWQAQHVLPLEVKWLSDKNVDKK